MKLQNYTLPCNYLITTPLQSPPYTMLKLDAKSARRTGNDRYEGFVIDLASAIAAAVGFNFSVHIADGYGSMDENGERNGMIRELLDEVQKKHIFYLLAYDDKAAVSIVPLLSSWSSSVPRTQNKN